MSWKLYSKLRKNVSHAHSRLISKKMDTKLHLIIYLACLEVSELPPMLVHKMFFTKLFFDLFWSLYIDCYQTCTQHQRKKKISSNRMIVWILRKERSPSVNLMPIRPLAWYWLFSVSFATVNWIWRTGVAAAGLAFRQYR